MNRSKLDAGRREESVEKTDSSLRHTTFDSLSLECGDDPFAIYPRKVPLSGGDQREFVIARIFKLITEL